MRRFYLLCSALVVLAVILTACGSKATPTPTEPPVIITVVVTAAPTETPAQVPADSGPTLEPINLAGPEMVVGGTWKYVDGSTLVAVPGGPFLMGRDGGSDNPLHEVNLREFWIYRTEVTNQQYAYCVSQGICSSPNLEDSPGYFDIFRVNDPVTGVNWDQATTYCNDFVRGRLPSEAEWEKTARGPDGNIYPWGDEAPTCGLLNFNNCIGKTTDVNTYPMGMSYYEAFDMSGNAYEWVADRYDPLYYRNGPIEDPLGPDLGDRRSIRSSGYKSNKDQAPAAVRYFDFPNNTGRDRGFRCVVEDPTYFAPWCEQIAYVGANQGGGGQDPVVIPTPDCADVSISAGGWCNDGVPAANLNFGPNPMPPGTIVNVPVGCSGAYPLYYCTSNGMASIQAYCSVPPAPPSTGCDPGYTPDAVDPDKCVWTGGGTEGIECLPGSTYDPVRQCCTSGDGSGDAYLKCPAAAPYYNGAFCTTWPSAGLLPPENVNVIVGYCEPDGGDDPCPTTDPNYPTCDPGGCRNPPTCTFPYILSGCTCVCHPQYTYYCNQ